MSFFIKSCALLANLNCHGRWDTAFCFLSICLKRCPVLVPHSTLVVPKAETEFCFRSPIKENYGHSCNNLLRAHSRKKRKKNKAEGKLSLF
uniref:Predicted protein n=1 Tax=Hordeum vulgare subsp. vulgare TaxID=112509 RepID=F2DP93_HORVV|nr:predicted protein [Hordeum vulgare subsp. vulgare]